jgi:hypothetical protein
MTIIVACLPPFRPPRSTALFSFKDWNVHEEGILGDQEIL